MKRAQELYGIELLRFFCAAGVVVWHYQHFVFYGAYNADVAAALRSTLPLYSALHVFYDYGFQAVQFFWVISGCIFYRQYADQIAGKMVGFNDFLLRRFSRLYPLHFATLIFMAVGQYAYFNSHGETFIYASNKPIWFVCQLFFASNWFAWQPFTFNGPIWSVSAEILIYLSFFCIARLFGSRTIVAAVIAVTCFLCFNYLHSFVNSTVFRCGAYFFAGGIAGKLCMRKGALPSAALVAAGVIVVLKLGLFRMNGILLLPLAMSAVILMARLGDLAPSLPLQRVAFLGNATYSSYLLQLPLQLTLVLYVDAMGWQREIFLRPFALLAYMLGLIVLSLLVHRYFEMPMQALIRKRSSQSADRRFAEMARERKAGRA